MASVIRRVGGALAAVTTAVVFIGAPAQAAAPHENLHGTFRETAAGSQLDYDIAGSAKLTVGEAFTIAKVTVTGLDPDKEYGSHLHDLSCSQGGGGHYQDDEGGAVTPPNELWLSSSEDPLGKLEPNSGGVAHGSGSAEWAARLTSETATNAKSIVVHEAGASTRIACADLI